MKNRFWLFCVIFWLCLLFALCGNAQVNSTLGEWPRIVPRTFTYSQVFPVGDRDYVRNAFVKIKSGSDTSIFFVDRYGNFQKVKAGGGSNGIYGGSGTVPTNTVASVTNTMTFSGASELGPSLVPFRVIGNSGADTPILGLYNETDSLVFGRADQEFTIGSSNGLDISAANALSLNGDSILMFGLAASSATEKTFLQIASSGALKTQEGVNISQINDLTGSATQIPVFTSGTAIAGSNSLVFSGGQLGINTASPTQKLFVNEGGIESASGSNNSSIRVQGGSGWETYAFRVYAGSSEDFNIRNADALGYTTIGTQDASTNQSLRIRTGINRGDSIYIQSSKISFGSGDWPYQNFAEMQGQTVTMLNRFKVDGLQIESYSQSAATGTLTVSTTKTDNLYKPGADQAALTIVLPASAIDGQICKVTFYVNVSTVTFDYNGGSNFGGWPANANAGDTFVIKFYSGSGWSLVSP